MNNTTSGSLASGTGITGLTLALSVAIQVALYHLFDASVTNEQAGAFALLLYPFVHLAYAKIGYSPNGNGNGTARVEPKTDAQQSPATP